MIKRVLGIILIIIIILIGIGYCSGKRSSENTSRANLNGVSSELKDINGSLINYGNDILSVWEDTNNNGSISKKSMASITNAPYDKFVTMTKEYSSETYTDGLQAAKVESAYYNNSGIFPDIKETLNNIKTRLNDVKDTGSNEYKTALNNYNNEEELLELLSNPSGNFENYRESIYKREKNN